MMNITCFPDDGGSGHLRSAGLRSELKGLVAREDSRSCQMTKATLARTNSNCTKLGKLWELRRSQCEDTNIISSHRFVQLQLLKSITWRCCSGLYYPSKIYQTLWAIHYKNICCIYIVRDVPVGRHDIYLCTCIRLNNRTNSMESSSSWGVNSGSNTPRNSLYAHPNSLPFILVSPSHLCLDLQSGIFPSGFPITIF
jgi:hypothetical protein